MYRFLHVSDSNLLIYMKFYFAEKSVGRVVRFYASSPEIDPRVLQILLLKRFTLSWRFEKSKFSVNSTGICTKYWLTASVMLAQCSLVTDHPEMVPTVYVE